MSIQKIAEVESLIKRKEEILALEEAEKERKRAKFAKLSPEEQELAVYIDEVLASQNDEPLRKNVTSRVKPETFRFFMDLFLLPLPGRQDSVAWVKLVFSTFWRF